jgi:hypothetical protein
MVVLGDETYHMAKLTFCDNGKYLCGLSSHRLRVFELGMPATGPH